MRGVRGTGTVSGGSSSRAATSGRNRSGSREQKHQIYFTDQDRIKRAMSIVHRMEAWARTTHHQEWKGKKDKDDNASMDEEDSYGDEIMEGLDPDEDEDSEEEDDTLIENSMSDEEHKSASSSNVKRTSSFMLRQHNKARDLDVEVYNSVLVAWARDGRGDHSASVMRLLDRMEKLAEELDMPSVRPNQRS